MSGVVFRQRKARQQVTLNVTSLIDVLFLLLIFFMLTGTFKRAGELELDLPGSTSATPTETTPRDELVIVVTEAGEIRLGDAQVDHRGLRERLARERNAQPERGVVLQAEAGVDHGEVVRILDLVREVGFAGMRIGTYLEEAPAEP